MKTVETVKHGEHIIEYQFKSGLKLTHIKSFNTIKSFVELKVNLGSKHTHYEVKSKVYEIKRGSAHFLEHLCFRSKGNLIYDHFFEQGLDVNAQTGYEYTSYFFETTSLSENMIELLLRLTKPRLIDENDFEMERQIIKHELEGYEADLDESFLMAFKRLIFIDHPYQTDILGTHESLNDMNVEQMNHLFHHTYQYKHMHLYITSAHVDQEILKMLDSIDPSMIDLATFVTGEKVKIASEDMIVYDLKEQANRLMAYVIIPEKLSYQTHLALNLYTYLMLNQHMSFYDHLEHKKMFETFLTFSYTAYEHFSYLYFYADSKKIKHLIKHIKNHFNTFEIDEVSFTSGKKTLQYKLIKMMNQASEKHQLALDLSVFHINLVQNIDHYLNLDYDTFKTIIETYHFKNFHVFQTKK